MAQTTSGEAEETVVHAKVYGNGRVRLSATANPAEAKLVSYALARATRTHPYIDLDFFCDILIHGGVPDDRIAAIASTAKVTDDESYYGPRG